MLLAGRQLLREIGFSELTVDDVRLRAGTSRATFYFYFRNKKHLLFSVASSVMDELYEVAGRHYPECDEFSRIVLANVAYLDVWRRESNILGEFFALSLTDQEAWGIYSGYRTKFEERIKGRVERLLAQHRIPATSPGVLAASLSSMVEFAAFRFFFLRDPLLTAETGFDGLLRVLSEAWYQSVYGQKAPRDYNYTQHASS